jgi:S-adenosylmethionine:tRNA ribosyltransferase-isomerase
MPELNPNDYNYDLPRERIAQYPLQDRDSSKLLVFRNDNISEDNFINLPRYIPEGSLLVFNNTRVIRARLIFFKHSGARIEVFCVEPVNPADYSLSFGSREPVEWKCIIGNLKKWKKGSLQMQISGIHGNHKLLAERIRKEENLWRIRFSWDLKNTTFGEVIEIAGHTPLPPYINREDVKEDHVRYQTIYALQKGSVAAPTAGLHFTNKVLEDLHSNGVFFTDVTLHVGVGTFQPIKSDKIKNHIMHTEHFYITATSIESIHKHIGKIIAVGTTSVRTLESLYWLGVKLINNADSDPDRLYINQWEVYDHQDNISTYESIGYVLSWMQNKKLSSIHASTRLIIVPGYHFRVIEGMVTNFHLPKSTLLFLISAWTGNSWKNIYAYAMNHNFRFLSYGDSSLLLR